MDKPSLWLYELTLSVSRLDMQSKQVVPWTQLLPTLTVRLLQ